MTQINALPHRRQPIIIIHSHHDLIRVCLLERDVSSRVRAPRDDVEVPQFGRGDGEEGGGLQGGAVSDIVVGGEDGAEYAVRGE